MGNWRAGDGCGEGGEEGWKKTLIGGRKLDRWDKLDELVTR